MSDLNPQGVAVTLGGEERRLLFTLNAVDALQDAHDAPLEEIINRLADKRQSVPALKSILSVLLNDEADRAQAQGRELKRYTPQEAGWLVSQANVVEATMAVLKAYGLSLPEPDEYSRPNAGGRNG